MLAVVDDGLMDAVLPRSIPGALDRPAVGATVELKVDVAGAASGKKFITRFDPRSFFGGEPPRLRRPASRSTARLPIWTTAGDKTGGAG